MVARQYLGRFLAATGDTGSLTSCYRSSSTRVVCGAKAIPSSDITCSLQITVWNTPVNGAGYYYTRYRGSGVSCRPVSPPSPPVTPPSTPNVPTVPVVPPVGLCGAPPNPFGYTLCGGNVIYNPPPNFCAYFSYIAAFWQSTNGYVEECADGMFSHSGGVSGSCSYHGGNGQPLYQP
jgi:hypothetical protein